MNEEDFLYGRTNRNLSERKEVKVQLPIAHLIRLHGMKLLQGKTITDAVTEALDMYFREVLEPAAKATAKVQAAPAAA